MNFGIKANYRNYISLYELISIYKKTTNRHISINTNKVK